MNTTLGMNDIWDSATSHYAGCRILYSYVECRYAECRYADCRGAVSYDLKIFMKLATGFKCC